MNNSQLDYDSIQTQAEKVLIRHANQTAARLRQAADAIDREIAQLGRVGTSSITYGTIAADIQSQIFNALANAPITMITTDAAEADFYRAKGK